METLQTKLERWIDFALEKPHRFGDAKDLETMLCIYFEVWELLATDNEDSEWKKLWQRQCARVHSGHGHYTLADVHPFSINRVRKQVPATVVEKARRAVHKFAKKVRDELRQSIESNSAMDHQVLIDLLFERVDRYLKDAELWPTDLECVLETHINFLIELIQGQSAESFGLRYKTPIGPARTVFSLAKQSPVYPNTEQWAAYDQIAKGMKTVFGQLKQLACHKSAVH